MTQTTFVPNHKITVVSDIHNTMILFASKGSWMYDTVLHQHNNVDSTNYTGEQKLEDAKMIADTIQKSDFLSILISKLIASGLKFYIELSNTERVMVGVRSNNIITWFDFYGENHLHFNHIYNQTTGKTIKSFRQGYTKQEAIEKKIGIKFSMLTNN